MHFQQAVDRCSTSPPNCLLLPGAQPAPAAAPSMAVLAAEAVLSWCTNCCCVLVRGEPLLGVSSEDCSTFSALGRSSGRGDMRALHGGGRGRVGDCGGPQGTQPRPGSLGPDHNRDSSQALPARNAFRLIHHIPQLCCLQAAQRHAGTPPPPPTTHHHTHTATTHTPPPPPQTPCAARPPASLDHAGKALRAGGQQRQPARAQVLVLLAPRRQLGARGQLQQGGAQREHVGLVQLAQLAVHHLQRQVAARKDDGGWGGGALSVEPSGQGRGQPRIWPLVAAALNFFTQTHRGLRLSFHQNTHQVRRHCPPPPHRQSPSSNSAGARRSSRVASPKSPSL